MEFKDFAEKRKRMCENHPQCSGCPLYSKELPDRFLITYTCKDWCLNHPELAEPIVDDWTKANPILTNAEKFKEVFGVYINYSLDNPGYLYIDGLIQKSSLNKMADVVKWLDSEYISPEEKSHDT